MVWALGLVGVVLPAFVLLLLVRSVAERIEPGYGTAAAVALGAGTLILPFSTLFFSHVLSAMLAFAAFAVLWRERAGPPRLLLVAAAGALAGFAIATEYPLGLAAVVLGVYAMRRSLRRGAGVRRRASPPGSLRSSPTTCGRSAARRTRRTRARSRSRATRATTWSG